MKQLLLLLVAISAATSFAQSIHELDLLAHPDTGIELVPQNLSQQHVKSGCALDKMVFGWHPYWVNGLEDNYNWDLISDLCYFSYEVDAATGNATSTHSWATADVIDTALVRGKQVHLCVTLFSQHATLFGSSAAQTTLINNLVGLLQSRGAHGINIDFEGVPASQAANLTIFMTNLGTALHTANPNYKLSICLYAVDWNNVFNEPALAAVVDFFTVMGYDYYYSGSTQAGPSDPLYGFTNAYDYSISRSISYYLNAGIPATKLVLGLPYYGREWETTTNAVPGATTGSNNYSRTYQFVKDNASGNYVNPIENTRSSSYAYIFQNAGTWRQCWISEGKQMKDRYDLVRRRNLKGIGIWTLGYDEGYTDLWDAIDEKLTGCFAWACSDTLYDEGGPEVSYYNNELVQYTIAPAGATAMNVDFAEFETEEDFDTLWLYDGASTNAPLIGAYSGTAGPGQFTAASGMLTLRFKSDGGTRAPGWKLIYSCIPDDEPPITAVSTANPWITEDAAANFNDADNSSVEQRYWNAQSLLSGEWQSNTATGHVFDEFVSQGNWTAVTGQWAINNGTIVQTDQTNGNTNLALTVPLASTDAYLFHWKGSISGSGTNRRAGFHFMCGDLSLPNRGNSYFVWFRVDNDVIQLYEVTNDVFTVTASFPFTIDPGVSYDCKTTYSLLAGKMELYVNNQFVGSWTDPTPLTISTGISLRSANAAFTVEQAAVYASRTTTANILTGTNGHFTVSNPSPAVSAGRISSIVIDEAHNTGTSSQEFDVDFTAPDVSVPQEELSDIDTLLNTTGLTLANLFAIDENSGIAAFSVSILHSNGTVILPETAVTSATLFETLSGLVSGETYRIRVHASNNAGLLGDTIFSDGFIYLNTLSAAENVLAPFSVYPNPATTSFTLEVPSAGKVVIVNTLGERVFEQVLPAGKTSVDCSDFASGTYLILFENGIFRMVKP